MEFGGSLRKDASKINVFKVTPLDGAVGQPLIGLELTWKATKTTRAIAYEYCFFPIDDTDTTPISEDDTCSYNDENWETSLTDISAIVDSLSDATTYYWQVRANIGTDDDPDWVYADKGEYWPFTTLLAP